MNKVLTMDNTLGIKDVAIYLRKSRVEETEEDLANHKKILVDLCNRYNWHYEIYPEAVSGATIEMRPKFQELLKDVKREKFDAVLVVDTDRLSRGSAADMEVIKQTFIDSGTYLCVNNRVMDLTDDSDEFILEMESFVARMEFRMIKKRFRRGKVVGAERGRWTNGKPPYPYEYEHYLDEKGHMQGKVVINPDKLKTYRRMVDAVVKDGNTLGTIAKELNKDKIASPGGKEWTGVTIQRILLDMTHLGMIVTNKTKGNAHKNKPTNAKKYEIIDKADWIISEGAHKAVKTLEEHDKIILFFARDTKTPKRTSGAKNILPLTGLIKCSVCGSTLSLQKGTKDTYAPIIKKCWYSDGLGNKCENRGGPMRLVEEAVNNEILAYAEKISEDIDKKDVNLINRLEGTIADKEASIISNEAKIERIRNGYDDGLYSSEEAKKRIAAVNKDTSILKSEIIDIQGVLDRSSHIIEKSRLDIIDDFKACLAKKDVLTDEQWNNLYKSIVKSVEWTRVGDDISIKINFL